MRDVFSEAQSIANWRTRRLANGRSVTLDDVRAQILTRWPDRARVDVERIVVLCQLPRDEQVRLALEEDAQA